MNKLNEKTPFSIIERALRIREKRKLERLTKNFRAIDDSYDSDRIQNEQDKKGNDLYFDHKKMSTSRNEGSTFVDFEDFEDFENWFDWVRNR